MYVNYDRLQISIYKYNSLSALHARFKKVWETKTVDGIECYKGSLVWWDGSRVRDDYKFNRFTNALGVEKSQLAENIDEGRDYDEVEQIWFSLVQKSDESQVLEREDILEFIDEIPKNQSFRITLSTFDDRYITKSGLTAVLSPEGKIALENDMFIDHYFQYANWFRRTASSLPLDPDAPVFNSVTSNSSLNDDPYKFAMLLPKFYDYSVVQVYVKPVITKSGPKFTTIMVLNVKKKTPDDFEVKDMEPLYKYYEAYRNKFVRNHETTEVKYSTLEASTFSIEMTKLIEEDYPPTDDSLWYKRLLRVDASNKMKKKDFAKLLQFNMDSGYRIKDTEWWEYVVGAILVILTIIIFFLTWGTTSGFLLSGWSWVIMTLSVTVAVGSYVLATEGGKSATHVVTVVGDVSMWVGVATAIVGIYSMISNYMDAARTATTAAGTAAATTAATTTATTTTTTTTAAATTAGTAAVNVTVSQVIDYTVDLVIRSFSSVSSFTNTIINVVNIVSTVSQTYDTIKNNLASDHNQSSVDEFVDDEENSQIVFEKYQFEMLTQIDMMYADAYDYNKYYSSSERKSII